MRYFVEVDGQELELEVTAAPDGSFVVVPRPGSGAPGVSARVSRRAHGISTVELGGRTLEVRSAGDGEAPRVLGVAARVVSARERALSRVAASGATPSSELRAPMPGR